MFRGAPPGIPTGITLPAKYCISAAQEQRNTECTHLECKHAEALRQGAPHAARLARNRRLLLWAERVAACGVVAWGRTCDVVALG